MLNTMFTFSADCVRFHRLELRMTHISSLMLKQFGLQVEMYFGDAALGQAPLLCKGLLRAYHPWSESPTALALRVLHTLYTEWHQSIPPQLVADGVASMRIDIEYSPSTEDEVTTLESVTLCNDESEVGIYQLSRSGEEASIWSIGTPSCEVQPLCVALKLLAHMHGESVDLCDYPPAAVMAADSDVLNLQKSIFSVVPDYAHDAFRVFMGSTSPTLNCENLAGRHRLWELFLST